MCRGWARCRRIGKFCEPSVFASWVEQGRDRGAGTSGNTPVTFLPMELISADGRVDGSDIRPLASVSSGFTYMRRDDVIIAKITPCFENRKGRVS